MASSLYSIHRAGPLFLLPISNSQPPKLPRTSLSNPNPSHRFLLHPDLSAPAPSQTTPLQILGQNPNPRTKPKSPPPFRKNIYKNYQKLSDPHPPSMKTMKPSNPPPPPDVDLTSSCRDGMIKEALDFLSQGVPADYGVFDMLLDSCGNWKSLELGKKVQQFLIRSPYGGDVKLNSRLVDMYVKCGSMRDARRMFDRMRQRNNLDL